MGSRRRPVSNVWKIFARQSRDEEDAEEYARDCYQARVIAVGWSAIGDLNELTSRDDLCDSLYALWGKEAKHGWKSVYNWAGSLWAFRDEVHKGDFVICPDRDSRRYYVGIIRSAHVYYDGTPLGGCEFAHRRKVRWITILNEQDIEQVWPDRQFGGISTVSQVREGADRFRDYMRRFARPSPRRARVTRGSHLPVQPDAEWGDEAEARAMAWLRQRGERPVNVASENRGWDIECGKKVFEVKGRRSEQTAIRLTQNEWAAAIRLRRNYTLLIFTAPDSQALRVARPVQIVDPARFAEWRKRVVYEYILNE